MSVANPVIDHIDPISRKIYLLSGVDEYHPVEDIYKEVRHLRRTTESLRGFDIFITAGGSLPKNVAGTERTPRYAIFHDCQIVISGDTYVAGEQLFADATGALVGKGKDCIDRILSPADAYVEYAPPEAEVIVVSTGSGLSIEEHDMLYRLKHLERAVYIDSSAVINGDGSQGNPFNNLQDAADYAESNSITTLVILAEITLDRAFESFTIKGIGYPIINTNGQDLNNSEFTNCELTGIYQNRIVAKNCSLIGGSYLNGEFSFCSVYGSFEIPDGGIAYLNCCSSRSLDFSPQPWFDIGGLHGSATFLLTNYKGTGAISNCTSPADLVRVSLNGGLIYIDETNTEDYAIGVIGNGLLINDSNSFASEHNLINKDGIAETVLNTVSS